MPSVLWHRWLGGRKGIRPVKNWAVECWRGICLEWGADLHMAQLMPLPLTVSCFSKSQIGFTFLVPAHPGSPGQRVVKRVCVCGWHLFGSFCSQLCSWVIDLNLWCIGTKLIDSIFQMTAAVLFLETVPFFRNLYYCFQVFILCIIYSSFASGPLIFECLKQPFLHVSNYGIVLCMPTCCFCHMICILYSERLIVCLCEAWSTCVHCAQNKNGPPI